MPNAQMDFRIDAELKRRGDERFASFGCTPSEAMRRLYECATRYDDESEEQLRRLLGAEGPRPKMKARSASRLSKISWHHFRPSGRHWGFLLILRGCSPMRT